MNRVVKFRAWIKGGSKWQYYTLQELMDGALRNLTVIPESVGEWTGLTDKNGTDIYEKDDFKLPSGNIVRIIWRTGGFGYNLNDLFYSFSNHNWVKGIFQGEVIGNEFESLKTE